MGESDHTYLIEVGELLFGARWQSDLARALGTSDRMVRYWVSGTHSPPTDLRQRLIVLLEERIQRMEGIIVQVRNAGKEGKKA